MIIPNVETFQITLDPKYIDLKNLSLEGYPVDPTITKLSLPETLNDSVNIAKYETGWQRFYTELGNAIANNPSFIELEKEFDYDLQFTISNKGLIENLGLISSDSVSSLEYDLFSSSIKSLKPWKPAEINNLPISQHFTLNILMGKEIFMVVENPATPQGGYQGFYKYVAKSLQYPEQARKEKIEGKVYVQFVVDKDGSLTDIEAVRGIGSGCDEEAVRIVQYAPKWSPAAQRGMPVKQRIILPITFILDK
ncbi:TonB family protein [Fulvivirga lutimaris]|nr:TonB family protein [Fulvivirga lutimaris]